MASEKKYIELEVAKETILNYIGEQTVSKYPSSELCRASRMGAEGAMYELEYAPTADVAEVRHGTWEDRPNPQWKAYDIRHCSKCGWNIPKNNLRKKDLNWNYCPHCGAKMDGGVTE